MRMTMILMAGVFIVTGFTVYFSLAPPTPGVKSLDPGTRVFTCAVLILTIALLYFQSRKAK